MSEPLQEHEIQQDLDLRALIVRLVAKRWWILASTVLFTGVFAAAAFFMTPVYGASVVLVPATTEKTSSILGAAASSLGGLASGLGLGGPKDSETEEALAVLKSREFTESFVHDLNLMPKLFWRRWNAATGTWKPSFFNEPTPAKAYKYFDKKVRSVTEDRKTGLVTIEIDWRDRFEAAQWANELVRRLNQEMRTRAIEHANASMNFLESELKSTSTVEVRDAISRLMENEVKQRMLANVTEDYSFRIVGRALPSDKDDPVKPNKPLMIIAGALVGLLLAVGVIFIQHLRARI